MIFGENNLIEYGILLDPRYNHSDLEFLIDGANHDSNFVDLGSNIGLYSQPYALASPNGKVISIDANPLMEARLSFNFQASSMKNIYFVLSAVSDRIGKGSLKIRKDDIAIVAIDENIQSNIKINTLKNIIKENNIKSIYGLKIDIEGHEFECIKGSIQTIKKFNPILMVEYDKKICAKIYRVLKKYKYKISYLFKHYIFSGVDTPTIFIPDLMTFEIVFKKINVSSVISLSLFINLFSGFIFPRFQ